MKKKILQLQLYTNNNKCSNNSTKNNNSSSSSSSKQNTYLVVQTTKSISTRKHLKGFSTTLHTRSTLQAQLDEQHRLADDEAKERSFLLGKYRNLEHEVRFSLP